LKGTAFPLEYLDPNLTAQLIQPQDRLRILGKMPLATPCWKYGSTSASSFAGRSLRRPSRWKRGTERERAGAMGVPLRGAPCRQRGVRLPATTPSCGPWRGRSRVLGTIYTSGVGARGEPWSGRVKRGSTAGGRRRSNVEVRAQRLRLAAGIGCRPRYRGAPGTVKRAAGRSENLASRVLDSITRCRRTSPFGSCETRSCNQA